MLTEYFSALTMAAPSLLMTYYYYTLPVNVCTKSIWIGTVLHAPFSIMYHVLCANHFFHDNVDNFSRKLDQIMIHICSICITLGVSKYTIYTNVAILFNELSISHICSAYSTKQIRRMNILLSVCIYVAPVLYEGHYWLGSQIVAYMAACIYFFVYNHHFHGYGQGLFHLFFCGMVHHLHSYCLQ